MDSIENDYIRGTYRQVECDLISLLTKIKGHTQTDGDTQTDTQIEREAIS
jgi:hypothetical protein